ncbi:hypothetical protein NDU88_003165 [Pleurodeles waltl]|uniref:Uncharacterized protein n=1 Tax=Pleurodeles waltl TaxID=8319 RepID=A0AAV7UF96_PLEWA|nr:hypothetical protein NDU88_003165 [Pleurodeles waltl]
MTRSDRDVPEVLRFGRGLAGRQSLGLGCTRDAEGRSPGEHRDRENRRLRAQEGAVSGWGRQQGGLYQPRGPTSPTTLLWTPRDTDPKKTRRRRPRCCRQLWSSARRCGVDLLPTLPPLLPS